MLGGLKCIFYAAFGNVASGIHVVVFWFVQSGATLSCCAVLVLANVSATNLVKHRNANAEVPHLVHSPFFYCFGATHFDYVSHVICVT